MGSSTISCADGSSITISDNGSGGDCAVFMEIDNKETGSKLEGTLQIVIGHQEVLDLISALLEHYRIVII